MREVMQLTLMCAKGGSDEYTNDRERQAASHLASLYHCTCHGEPMRVKQLVLWTEKARGNGFTVASFSDKTESEDQQGRI